MKFVENDFGLNDYYVIVVVLVLWSIFFILPRLFSKQVTVLVFLYTVSTSSVFDNSFGALAFDYYDIMDGPEYTMMDLVVYFIYPTCGIFYLYIFEKLRISRKTYLPFILVCSLLSIGFEWVCHEMNVFEYKNGYGIKYSFIIYVSVQSVFIFFYNKIRNAPEYGESSKTERSSE